jgi:threonine dehydratase
MMPLEWIQSAARRIAPHITRTPLTHDSKRNLWLKWENRQVTGSFKARGALNKVLSLEDWEREAGLVAASAGNHGQGVALAAQLTGSHVKVFAPDHAVPTKIEAMRALGADVELVPGGYELSERAGIDYAKAHNMTWVSPYNDGQIIAGQGTIGLELTAEMPIDSSMSIVVPAGGGGLISGIGAALENLKSRPKLIAVNPAASAFMHAIYIRGSQSGVSDLPTLADGLSGAVEEGSLTIPLVKQYVDDFVLVDEESIARAIASAWHRYGERIEGSAAVALAAILNGRIKPPAVIVLSGGNIQPEIHREICARYGGDQ